MSNFGDTTTNIASCYEDFIGQAVQINSVNVFANSTRVVGLELNTTAGIRQYGLFRSATMS
jgi:hypothetical protein